VCFHGFIIFIVVFFSFYIILVTKKKQITLIKKKIANKTHNKKKHLKSRECKYVNEHDVKSIRPIRMNPVHSMENP
jgi:predicted Holliday junction resolvase-like endonuclease